MRVAQPSIIRSAQAGHGRTINVHSQSKGENINQNYDWMRGQPYQRRTAAPAAAPSTNTANTPAKPKQTTQNKPQTNSDTDSNAKGVANGKAQNAVDGKDLAGKFKFDDSSPDYSIEQVIKAQGFDGKPTVTTDLSEFYSACNASNFIAKRGVGASNQRTLDAYDDALKNGDFYVKCSGGSVHGYGMYCASTTNAKVGDKAAASRLRHAEDTAKAYAGYHHPSKIYTMTLDKSAKIGTESALKSQMRSDTEFLKVCRSSKMRSYYTEDVGVYAAYKGYDAYVAGSGRSRSGSDYTVILNRSKVIIYEQAADTPF